MVTSRRIRVVVVTAVAAALAGCGWVRVESEREYPRPGEPSPRQAGAPVAEESLTADVQRRDRGVAVTEAGPMEVARDDDRPRVEEGTVRVREGDTVYSIARRVDRSPRDIIEGNDLEPPYRIVPGQRLMVPRDAPVHVVEPGETLFGLARQYGVETTRIVQANRLQPPYELNVGQRLSIPGADRDDATELAAHPATPEPPARPSEPDAEPGPAVERTRAPETQETARVPDGEVSIGLRTPRPERRPEQVQDPETAAEETEERPAPAAETAAPIPSPRHHQTEERPAETAAPEPPATETAVAPSAPQTATSLPDPPPRSGDGFAVPVEGRLLAEFGPLPGGMHNDGINIGAPRGTPIRAAENGVVIYTGDGVPGFGNLVLMKHEGGWITAYAHAEQILVERGQTVDRGAVIARVGSTGSVSDPQLHFELRRGDRAVDPGPYVFGRSG